MSTIIDEAAEETTAMELIFIRHGKAQDRSLGIPDEIRELTPKGKAEMRMFLGAVRRSFGADRKPGISGEAVPLRRELWTSPLKRARQTASLVGRQLKIKPQNKAFIADGDYEALTAAINQASPELDQIILVGHEPYLSIWYDRICGEPRSFAKGAIARIRLEAAEPELKGTGIEYLEPSGVLPKGISQEPVQVILGEALKKVASEEAAFLAEPNEPERVHQLRVKTRSLRSLLYLFRPFFPERIYKRLQRDWRSYGQALGDLRELDVLMEMSEKAALPENGAALRTYLEGLRESLKDKTLQQLQGSEGGVLRQRTVRLMAKYIDDHDADMFAFTNKKLRSEFKQFAGRRQQLNTIDDDLSSVHSLRIQAKKCRYILEAMGMFADEKYLVEYGSFKGLQSKIGDLCDAVRNQEALQEWIPDTAEEAVLLQRDVFIDRMWEKESELRLILPYSF